MERRRKPGPAASLRHCVGHQLVERRLAAGIVPGGRDLLAGLVGRERSNGREPDRDRLQTLQLRAVRRLVDAERDARSHRLARNECPVKGGPAKLKLQHDVAEAHVGAKARMTAQAWREVVVQQQRSRLEAPVAAADRHRALRIARPVHNGDRVLDLAPVARRLGLSAPLADHRLVEPAAKLDRAHLLTLFEHPAAHDVLVHLAELGQHQLDGILRDRLEARGAPVGDRDHRPSV